MKFSAALAFAAIPSLASAASSWTWTRTITNNGMTYTKVGTEEYTGQPTTEPTSGTYTYTNTIKGKDGTYTKIITNTYGQATTFTTHYVVSGPDETYTKGMTVAVHTTELSSFLSSHSSHLSEASVNAARASSSSAANSGSASATTTAAASGSSSSAGGAAGVRYGAEVGILAVAAAMLL